MENKNLNNFTILKKPKINSDKISYNNLYEPKQKLDDKYKYNIKESELNSDGTYNKCSTNKSHFIKLSLLNIKKAKKAPK